MSFWTNNVGQTEICPGVIPTDILNSTYFYTDFCFGPFWSGMDGNDLFTVYSLMNIYPELALSGVTVNSFDVTFELPGTQGALNLTIHNGDYTLLGTVAVAANATSAGLTVASLPRQFNYAESVTIGHDIAGGFNWGVTSIIAQVVI